MSGELKRGAVKFWRFLQKDTWQSWLVSLVIVLVLIKFVFFPTLSLVTGAPLPIVLVESCSMYHESEFEGWWDKNSDWYVERTELDAEVFQESAFHNGLNKGDVIFVWNRGDVDLGDIIIFEPNEESLSPNPIIHRVVALNPIATKGDHNSDFLRENNNPLRTDETNISGDQVLGKAVFRIPLVGWAKLIFYEPLRDERSRGLCS